MRDFLKNIILVFSNYKYLLLFFVLFGALFFLFELLTDDALIKGNLGLTYFYINFTLQLLISILFASFFTFFMYKYVAFSSFDKKNSATSFIGTIFGVLVGGCAACSLTVASYLGLGSVIAFLPYHGIELKLFGFLMLVYANFISIRDLQVCRINFNKKLNSSSK
jgi:hypothetical protein